MPELPFKIWKDRIENEIKNLERLNVLEENSIIHHKNSVEFIINIKALGFVLKHSKEILDLKPQISHRVFIKINRSFPYPGGIDFSWYSDIFHPNIHPVDSIFSQKPGTGYICLNILKTWSRLTDLETTIKALRMLVENPNPDDPLNYDICLRARDFFKQNPIKEFRKRYGFKEKEEQHKEEIIIVDD